MQVLSLGQEDLLEEAMAAHSSIIARRLLARKELENLVAGGLGGPHPLERIGIPDNLQANRPLNS